MTHRWSGPLHLTLHCSFCGTERRWTVDTAQYDIDTIDGMPCVQFHDQDTHAVGLGKEVRCKSCRSMPVLELVR